MAEIDDLREQLTETRIALAELKLKSTTVISGTELLVILCFFPLCASFVCLSIIIIWKVTSAPATVGPFLDIILLALAVVSNPVSAGVGSILGRYSEEVRQKKKEAD
jgi:hypothetical protein